MHGSPPGWDAYPRPSLAADLAIFTLELVPRTSPRGRTRLPDPQFKVLLVRRGEQPHAGSWALPGGFVREQEPVERAAARELEEETGVQGVAPHLFGVYSAPGRDPRGWVVSVAFSALVESSRLVPAGGSDAAEARWWRVDEAEHLELAFDHGRIFADAVAWVRQRVLTSLDVRQFLPETFVLAELYGVLQALVPGYRQQPANFRRRVIARGIIEPTGEPQPRYSQRPAQLFRFTGKEPDASVF